MEPATACVSASPTEHGERHAAGAVKAGQASHRTTRSDIKLRDLGPAAALLFIGGVGLLVATLSPSGKNGQYAIVAPPWYRLGQTIALVQAADGGIVDMGGPANMVIAHSRDPDFVRTLYRAGAWLVIDPHRLRGCAGFRRESGARPQ